MFSLKKFLIFFIVFNVTSLGFSASFYKIEKLNSSDRVFKNFQKTIKKRNLLWKKMRKNYSKKNLKSIGMLSIASYTLKVGDTIFSVADKLSLRVDTLISFNFLANENSIEEGSEILIPNMDGIILFPNEKTEISKIAEIYGIPKSLIVYINHIFGRDILFEKEEIFIPFSKMTNEQKSYFLNEPFIFPLTKGRISSLFGRRFHPIRKRYLFHAGVDIGTPVGTSVLASSKGRVIFAGEASGYGKLIVVKHKYGYATWYGHLSKIQKQVGDEVVQGEIIAKSGNSGLSTGPHLHFEVRRFNLRVNPVEKLSFNHSRVSVIVK